MSLGGIGAKMSSSGSEPTLFLNDTMSQIKKKVNKYAFSGGKDTLELHKKYGGNLNVDVSFQYLLYFCDDDALMKDIAGKYRSGEMLSGEIKAIMIEHVTRVIQEHQTERAKITPELLKKFFTRDRVFDTSRTEREDIELQTDEVYETYGVGFDREFGASPSEEVLEFEKELYSM